MSKPLSVLIVENFVINEGPKWDKFKKGAKKVGRGAVTAATIGSIALAGRGGTKISDANRNYESDMRTNLVDSGIKKHERFENVKYDFDNIKNDENLTSETKKTLIDQLSKNYRRDLETNDRNKENRDTQIAARRNRDTKEGKQALIGAAGLGMVPLVAGAAALGAKGKKKKQENKSLKERLELVKSGMFLNEEDADTTVLEKERYSDGHTPESIATLHNVPVQDILDQIERGIKVEREHTSDKAEARLIAMDHLVELPDYYTRLDKMEEEGKKEYSTRGREDLINELEKK